MNSLIRPPSNKSSGQLYKITRSVWRWFRLLKSFFYDFTLYYESSMNIEENESQKLAARIIMETHVIEKGLTMRGMRPGFGTQRVLKLVELLNEYKIRYGTSDIQFLHGISVLKEYMSVHRNLSFQLSDVIADKVASLSLGLNIHLDPQVSTTKTEYFKHTEAPFPIFSASRSSMRYFNGEKVPQENLTRALNLSLNAPSACNRQSVRVHLYKNRDKVKEILDMQGGSRGFLDQVSDVIIVTFDMRCYFEAPERNTGYVDGGIYAMNLLYALHYYKIGACILNASHSPTKDRLARSILNLPKTESVVAYIACGDLDENVMHARSKRYSLESILTINTEF